MIIVAARTIMTSDVTIAQTEVTSTMTNGNRKYTLLSSMQQQMLFTVLRMTNLYGVIYIAIFVHLTEES